MTDPLTHPPTGAQVLLLNGWHDREIFGYTALDCVNAVCSSLNRRKSQDKAGDLCHTPGEYITHLLVPKLGAVYDPEVDLNPLADLGISVVEVDSCDPTKNGQRRFDAKALVEAIDGIIST